MIKNAVLDKSGFPLLQKFLDVSSLRHKLISGNIANVSTPGFKSSDVDFHGELRKAIDNDGHIEISPAEIHRIVHRRFWSTNPKKVME